MGYKVTNKNALFNKKENAVTDTIFFFETLEMAEEYYQKVLNSPFNKDTSEHILEPMTEEEDVKFGFILPLSYHLPYKTITRPIEIPNDEPYWVETRELILPSEINLKRQEGELSGLQE